MFEGSFYLDVDCRSAGSALFLFLEVNRAKSSKAFGLGLLLDDGFNVVNSLSGRGSARTLILSALIW